jgi:hypothetical protein
MSRQPVTKDLLIIGDSNVERNILHTGRLYSQLCASVPARNLNEFSMALNSFKAEKYTMVVLAMLTNIVIAAGSLKTKDVPARLLSIEACLKTLFLTIT